MLTEKAHHIFVDESGIFRIVNRTCQVQIRVTGVIGLPTTPRHLNAHFSVTIDLFGPHQASNAATYYSADLKGRDEATKRDDNQVLQGGRSEIGEATASVIDLLKGDTHIYICGLRERETGVTDALHEPCTGTG